MQLLIELLIHLAQENCQEYGSMSDEAGTHCLHIFQVSCSVVRRKQCCGSEPVAESTSRPKTSRAGEGSS